MGRSEAGSIGAFLLLAAGASPAQDAGPTVSGPVAQAIDDYLTRAVPFGFSGAALVMKGGQTILAQGYGVADRTTGSACSPETLFDLGPLAQPFTAAAVLVLEQQGKLRVQDTLERFLPDVPADKKKIQLHHLLTHTSGLPRTIPGVGPTLADREELVQAALRVALLDRPGADFVPSDAGYALLAAIVELVTGQPFEQALHELVLVPAGLASTGFRQDGALAAERAACAFLRPEEPLPEGARVLRLPRPQEEETYERELATEGWYSWGLRGAGGMLSCVADLARFELVLRSDSLLSKASRKKLFTPELDSFAYGWYVRRGLRKALTHERGGWTASGFSAHYARFPDGDACLVLLANVPRWPAVIEQDLREILLGGKAAPPPATVERTTAELSALAGEYEHPNGARWRASVDGSALLLEARNPKAFELHAGRLQGDQKLAVKNGERVAAGLLEDDFRALKELDLEYSYLRGVEDWWRELKGPHGKLLRSTLLGVIRDAEGVDHTVASLEFERGEELLDMRWVFGEIVTLDTGPPYLSRLRLVPDSEKSFVAYDLVRRARIAAARVGEHGELELELPGGKLPARKR